MIFADYPGHLWALLALVVCLVLLVWAFVAKQIKIGHKRWLILPVVLFPILVLLVLWWNPSNSTATSRKQPCKVLTFFDTSQSMSMADVGSKSRLDLAVQAFSKSLKDPSEDRPYFQLYGFDDGCYSTGSIDELRRWGSNSRLHSAWQMIHQQINTQVTEKDQESELSGAIIFTDGQAENKKAGLYRMFEDKNIPVVIVGVGSEEVVCDVALEEMKSPSRVAVDSAYAVSAVVRMNKQTDEPVTAKLYRNDSLVGEKVLTFSSRELAKTIEFDLTAASKGVDALRIEVQMKGDEINRDNNRGYRIVQVVANSKLKAILYSQVANFNIGKMRQALLSDEKIELDFRLEAVINPAKVNSKKLDVAKVEFPKSADELNKYDLVVLGPVNYQKFAESHGRTLYDYVTKRGGTVIFLPGYEKYSVDQCGDPALSALCPLLFTPGGSMVQSAVYEIPVDLTSEAKGLDLFSKCQDLTTAVIVPGYENAKKKPAASVVLTANEKPVITFHRVGRGSACLLNSHLLYQWYQADEEGGLLTSLLGELTSQIVRVSAEESCIEIAARHDSVDNSVVIEAYIEDHQYQPVSNANVLLDIDDKLLKMQPVSQGRYTAALTDCQKLSVLAKVKAEYGGTYLGEKSVVVELPQKRDEMSQTQANLTFLKKLAAEKNVTYMNMDKFDNKTMEVFRANRVVENSKELASIWHRWPIAIGLCVLLTVYWFIRRSAGLV